MNTFTTVGPAALAVRFAAGRLSVGTSDGRAGSHHVGRRAPGQPGQHSRRGTRRGDDRRTTRRHDRGDRSDCKGMVRQEPAARRPRPRSARGPVSTSTSSRPTFSSPDSSVSWPSRRLRVTSPSSTPPSCRCAPPAATWRVAPSTAMHPSTRRPATSAWTLSAVRPSWPPHRETSPCRTFSAMPGCAPRRATSASTGADGSVTVRTASGDVRVGSVRRAAVEIDTASGDVEIGVAAGTAAWLDVQALSGSVSSALDAADAPDDDAETVAIHAHTLSGDVRVRRATK